MLFTLGTSNRTSAEFFAELDRRQIGLLIDVRSSPHSRNPWACRGALEVEAARHGINYVWSGLILGGLNSTPTTDRDFMVAAEVVLEASAKAHVAIFCAEGDPTQCHRSYKVGAHLLVRHRIEAVNILRNGQEEGLARSLARTRLDFAPPCLRDSIGALVAVEPD